jgi:hypothetical protein
MMSSFQFEPMMRFIKPLNLYRRILFLATAVTALLFTSASIGSAQLPTSKKDRGPRAIAVIQWQADPQGRAIPRLLPVAILDGGKFYDASLYRATPIPMALETETVYEAQDKGEILGLFTVANALRASTDGRNWIGLGAWENVAPKMDWKFENRRESAELVRGIMQPSPEAVDTGDDRDYNKKRTTVYDEQGKEVPAGGTPKDDRPTLKRPADSPAPTSPSAPADDKGSAKKKDDDPDRPTIRRGGTQSQPQDTSTQANKKPEDDAKSGNAKVDDDPDRPRIKRGAPASVPTKAADQAKAADSDPNRPVLRRGRPQSKKEVEEQSLGKPVPQRVAQRGARAADENSSNANATYLKRIRIYEAVAVSDANKTPADTFRFKWTDDEQQQIKAKMAALAQKEIDNFLRSTGRAPAGAAASAAARSAKSARQSPEAMRKSQFRDGDIRIDALDLNHNNSAEIVFSGREAIPNQTGPAHRVYVTLVARVDLEGNPRKLFANVTSDDRLDAVPRLELVDAVDADGNDRGELLFRRITDVGTDFAIYRIGIDDVVEMFHGGSTE